MKVRALCGIVYNNVLYRRGDEIEVPRVMANTVIISKDKSETEPPEELPQKEKPEEQKKQSRKRGERNA